MAERRFDLAEEFRIVPGVAIVIAVLLFGGMQYLWHGFIPTQHDPPPFWFRLIFGLFTGALLAMVVLLIGYVNRDAKRRGMNRVLWTLLVIFIPNALGFVLYFLVRHPLAGSCPKCGSLVQPGFNFCPNCRYALAPMCGGCGKPLQPEFHNCPYCGQPANAPVKISS